MIEFWDCSAAQAFDSLNGRELDAADLVDLARLRARAGRLDDDALATADGLADFHPLAATRPARWERAIATTALALCGELPTRDELLHGREVLAGLPRPLRASLRPMDIVRTLTPLLIGFRLSRAADVVAEANRHRDMARVMARLLCEKPIELDIPLCAHREDPRVQPLALAHRPDWVAQARALALLRVLLANARVRQAMVRLRQQEPSARAAGCIFPSVFAAYAMAGATEALLERLEEHRDAAQAQARLCSDAAVAFEVAGLDDLAAAAERDLDARFGEHWRLADAKILGATLRDTLRGRAFDDASRHVQRLMPELQGPPPALAPHSIASVRARDAEAWFLARTAMTSAGRALFEVAFYEAWARSAHATDSIGIGLDRDFAPFQRYAWQLAFGEAQSGAAPLLYARRTERRHRAGGLRNLSFRQFWTTSERTAAVRALSA